MLWTVILAALAALFLLSLLVSTPRRIWAFHLYAAKYIALWLSDVIGLRRLWLRLRGIPHRKITRPMALRLFCEDMGPTFIKFGQIVASSAGLFSKEYVEEFRLCLDSVRPFAFADVVAILESELGPDRAAQLAEIDPKPLASASIAQVHAASLQDGTKVVVKVQRPAIKERVEADMRIMRFVAVIVAKVRRDARFANPVGIVEDFAATLAEELDFCLEADNQERFNELMVGLGYTDIRAPAAHRSLSTARVLVMERFFGIRIDDETGIKASGVDAEAALIKGMRAWFQSVLFHGFFHGDVHAGNLMLLDDGGIGFLDFGIVGRFDDHQRRMVTDYIVAFATGNFRRLAEVISEMEGVGGKNTDLDAFGEDLRKVYEPLLSMRFSDVNYAEFAPKITAVARTHNVVMPKEFVLITKQMLYFDRYAKMLAPNLNVFTDPRLIAGLVMDVQKARASEA